VEAYLAQIIGNVDATIVTSADDEEYMELRYTFQSAKLAYQQSGEGRQTEPMLHCDGEHLCVRIDKTTGSSRKVAQRDDALLLPNQVQKNWKEVVVAIKHEFETWVKHGCVSRRKRTDARNITDVKRVIKSKIGPDAQSAQESQQTGTSQRYSQRVLVSVAVQSQWDICTSDINKASLQGVTYKALAGTTGEPLR